MRRSFVRSWSLRNGCGSSIDLIFLGGAVFLKTGYEDGVDMSTSCASSGICSLEELEAVLRMPPAPFDDRSPDHLVWRVPVRGYNFFSVGKFDAPPPTEEARGEIVFGQGEGVRALEAVRLHKLGWRPLCTSGLHPAWGINVSGERIQAPSSTFFLPPSCWFARVPSTARFLVRVPTAENSSRHLRLYAEGVDEIVESIGGVKKQRYERWRTCRFLDPTLFMGDETPQTRALTRAFYPQGEELYGSTYGANHLRSAMVEALALSDEVRWEREDADPRFSAIVVDRPWSSCQSTLKLTFVERRADDSAEPKSFKLEVPGVELLARLSVAYHARSQARPVSMPTTAIDLALLPSTARSLYRLLTGEF